MASFGIAMMASFGKSALDGVFWHGLFTQKDQNFASMAVLPYPTVGRIARSQRDPRVPQTPVGFLAPRPIGAPEIPKASVAACNSILLFVVDGA